MPKATSSSTTAIPLTNLPDFSGVAEAEAEMLTGRRTIIQPLVDAATDAVRELQGFAASRVVDRYLSLSALDGLYKVALAITRSATRKIADDVAYSWGWLRSLNKLSLRFRYSRAADAGHRHIPLRRTHWSVIGLGVMTFAMYLALHGHMAVVAALVAGRVAAGAFLPAVGMYAEPSQTASVNRLLGADFAACVAGHATDALTLVAVAAGLASAERNMWSFAVMFIALGLMTAVALRTSALQWGLRIDRMPAERIFRSVLPAATLVVVGLLFSNPAAATVTPLEIPPLAFVAVGPAVLGAIEIYRTMRLRRPVLAMMSQPGEYPHPLHVLAWGAPESSGVFGDEKPTGTDDGVTELRPAG